MSVLLHDPGMTEWERDEMSYGKIDPKIDEQIVERHRAKMNAVAQTLDELFNGDDDPKKVGFVLLISEFGVIKDGRVNYISNGNRADIITMMKEILARFEGQAEAKGHG